MNEKDGNNNSNYEKQVNYVENYLLNMEDVSVEDDLDSLTAVNLSCKIEDKFGVKMPIENFANGEIKTLAKNIVDSKNKKQDKSPLVALQTKGSRSNLFLVHPIGGNAYCYTYLAEELAGEIPVYSFRIVDEKSKKSIKEMASEYIEAMKKVQKSGPYYLGGWSFGGIVAFEMARQLVESGEEVKKVILIESVLIDDSESIKDEKILAEFISNLASIYNKNVKVSEDEFKGMSSEEMKNHYIKILKREGMFVEEYKDYLLDTFFQLYKNNIIAGKEYKPKVYDGDVLIIKGEVLAENFAARYPKIKEKFAGWDKFTSKKPEVRYSQGLHWNLIYKPNVVSLANILREYIE